VGTSRISGGRPIAVYWSALMCLSFFCHRVRGGRYHPPVHAV